MAKKDKGSREYASIWLLVSTWERIAIFAKEFSKPQRQKFFRCAPVGLMWKQLEPGIKAIRADRDVGDTFAKEFEDLANLYDAWTKLPDGKEFRTDSAQCVHAMFG